MDEVFCDVTEVVTKQWVKLQGGTIHTEQGLGKAWWGLRSDDPPSAEADTTEEDWTAGFWYDVDLPPGHLEPLASTSRKARSPGSHASPILLASHLANHLRQAVRSSLGFPSSAGVGPSKMLAKLLSETHKPDGLTSWCWRSNAGDVAGRVEEEKEARAKWVADVDPAKVQGFGFKVLQKIREEIFPPPIPPKAPSTSVASPTSPDPPDLPLWAQRPPSSSTPLTLGLMRSSPSMTPPILSQLFTPKEGSHLYGLLWGDDSAPVVMSPDWPAQIGCEDSFWEFGKGKGCTWTAWEGEVRRIARNLVARLEGELKEAVPHHPTKRARVNGSSPVRDPSSSRWVQYPSRLRLTVMLRGVGRQSKTVAMPVEVFDDAKMDLATRAEKVVGAAKGLWRSLVGTRTTEDIHM